MKAILAELGGELQVALEATYGWEWLADLLEQEGHELHLSHPLRTKAIAAARVKTDAVDARTLAQLLRTDLLPEAYVAPREVRDLRDLLRHRVVLTPMASALKNRVHALVRAIAAPIPALAPVRITVEPDSSGVPDTDVSVRSSASHATTRISPCTVRSSYVRSRTFGQRQALPRGNVELEPVPGAGDDLALPDPRELPVGVRPDVERARDAALAERS